MAAFPTAFHPNAGDTALAMVRRAASRAAGTRIGRVVPGLLLCVSVTLVATGLERVEVRLAGAAWLESLVWAILIGTAVRTAWTPGQRWNAGIDFSAKFLLEVAVLLLGVSVSARTVLAAGPGLLVGIAAVVMLAIACSYGIGRLLGLPHRMATLIACGNSICGNSAIAAVAPIIGADGDDVAASIAFTAVLGVVVVLALPLTVPLLHLSGLQYGALAGLTVYAVPQVLAATATVGPVAVQLGALVKLVRVLMLGPVVLGLSLLTRRPAGTGQAAAAQDGAVVHPGLPRPRWHPLRRTDPERCAGPDSMGRQPADRHLHGGPWPRHRSAAGGAGGRAGHGGGHRLPACPRRDQPRPDPPARPCVRCA
jgi:uncharacterized integral membrane protein (TIGR00698 family)